MVEKEAARIFRRNGVYKSPYVVDDSSSDETSSSDEAEASVSSADISDKMSVDRRIADGADKFASAPQTIPAKRAANSDFGDLPFNSKMVKRWCESI